MKAHGFGNNRVTRWRVVRRAITIPPASRKDIDVKDIDLVEPHAD